MGLHVSGKIISYTPHPFSQHLATHFHYILAKETDLIGYKFENTSTIITQKLLYTDFNETEISEKDIL